jgi:hypothetical protein
VLGRVLAAAEPGRSPAERRPRVRRGPRAKLALAAVAVLLVAGGVAAGVATSQSNHQVVAASWTDSSSGQLYPGDSVTATVRVTAADSGSFIDLTMSNIPKGYRCSLVVVTTDGARHRGDSWTAPTSGQFTIPDMVSTAPDKIASVQVVLPNGTTLMTLEQ